MNPRPVTSSITFLYFKDLEEISIFFEDTMQFNLVVDQGPAKIYQISDKAFVGIVDEKVGYRKTSDNNALLITLVAEDVEKWHEKIKGCKAVTSCTDVEVKEQFGIKGFFFEGPGGYSFEIQKFLDPGLSGIF